MKHINRRKIAFLAVILFTFALSVAFDWPQNENSTNSFFSYFGQLRGGTIETSLIFNDNEDISAAEDGKIVIYITEHTDDFGWFESTLGNAIILGHNDNLATVYANLDEDEIPSEIDYASEVKKGTKLGVSGNSAWQEADSCLEFQVIDLERHTAINPRILMPHSGSELELDIGRITLDDEKGETHYLINERVLNSGLYSVYRTRQEVAIPARTVLGLNGATVESIEYDILKKVNGKLCVLANNGDKAYSVEDIYPDTERQLLGKIQLTRGHAALSITVVNFLNSAKTTTYNLDIN